MQKVIFTDKRGRERAMHGRYADLLQKLGRGTYTTRDMVPVAPIMVPVAGPEQAGEVETEAPKKRGRPRKPKAE